MVAEVGLPMILIMCKMICQLLHMCPHMVAAVGLQIVMICKLNLLVQGRATPKEKSEETNPPVAPPPPAKSRGRNR